MIPHLFFGFLPDGLDEGDGGFPDSGESFWSGQKSP